MKGPGRNALSLHVHVLPHRSCEPIIESAHNPHHRHESRAKPAPRPALRCLTSTLRRAQRYDPGWCSAGSVDRRLMSVISPGVSATGRHDSGAMTRSLGVCFVSLGAMLHRSNSCRTAPLPRTPALARSSLYAPDLLPGPVLHNDPRENHQLIAIADGRLLIRGGSHGNRNSGPALTASWRRRQILPALCTKQRSGRLPL